MDFAKPVLEGGKIDFKGQKLAGTLLNVLLVASTLSALLVGYVTKRVDWCFFVYMGGVALSYVAVMFPWPAYRQSPVSWLKKDKPEAGAPSKAASTTTATKPSSSKTSRRSLKASVEDVSDDNAK